MQEKCVDSTGEEARRYEGGGNAAHNWILSGQRVVDNGKVFHEL